MLCYHKKSKHNLYEQLDYLGLNPYEQRHFCFGGAGSGGTDAGGGFGDGPAGDPGGEAEAGYDIGFSSAAQEASAAAADAAAAAAAEQAGWAEMMGGRTEDEKDEEQASWDSLSNPNPSEAQFDPLGLFAPPDPEIVSYPKLKKILYPKYNPAALLQDPVQMLPKLDSLIDKDTAKELSANYLDMLKEAGIEAAKEKNTGLMETIQTQLNTGLLSDYYTNFTPMNELEKAGFNTFGTGYRGEYEARAPNALSREEYDPVTLMASGTGPRSGTLSLFSQFAKENPAMTAMEALSAFNAVGSFGQLTEADLGMLGYSPNQAVGPQAARTENEREEGFYQGLSMLGRAASGPFGAIGLLSDIALSGTNTSMVGSILDGFNAATAGPDGRGIVDEVSSMYDEVAGPVSEAFDTAATNFGSFVDDSVNSLVDFFSPEQEAAYNSAIGMADPNIAGVSGVSFEGYSPFGIANTVSPEAFANYTNALTGLEEAERAEVLSGVPVETSMLLADPAFEVQGKGRTTFAPGSFFENLTPEQIKSHLDTVTNPEGTRRVREKRPYLLPAPPSIESDPFMPVSEQTSSFFPEVDLPNNSRFFELANIYGPERAQQLLGLA